MTPSQSATKNVFLKENQITFRKKNNDNRLLIENLHLLIKNLT